MRFTIRDLMWATVVVALIAALVMERRDSFWKQQTALKVADEIVAANRFELRSLDDRNLKLLAENEKLKAELKKAQASGKGISD